MQALDGPYIGYGRAAVYAGRGENDKAFESLEKVSGMSRSKILYETFFLVLHDDPRWQPLLEKGGVSANQLAAIDFKVTLPD